MNIKNVFSGSIINLICQVIPAVAAILMVPVTIKWFGSELFSVFSLAVSVIVLFNYLNFGVAQSTNRELAKTYSDSEGDISNSIISSGLVAIIFIGVGISIFGVFFYESIASSLVDNNEANLDQVENMLFYVFLSSPLFLLVILFRSILEARLLFKYTSMNRAILNAFIFCSPLLCYIFGVGLDYSIFYIIAAHVLSLVFLLSLIFKYFENLEFIFDKDVFFKLFTSGGWLTVISLSSVGLLYADKFIIGSALGLSALAYYVASYDLISRSSIIYGSITSAFFPAFSFWYNSGEYKLLNTSLKYLFDIMYLLMGVSLGLVSLFSSEILFYWIDYDFSLGSSYILQVLCFGIFFSSLSIINMRLLAAIGYEKKIAIFYLIQSTIYVLTSYLLVESVGALGIAWLFSGRCLFECVILHYFVKSTGLNSEPIFMKNICFRVGGFGVLLLCFFFNYDLFYKIIFAITVIMMILIWFAKNLAVLKSTLKKDYGREGAI
ncbi:MULTISPECIES: oligosaccharide flippase family protein [Shewanella]|uniref:oligosaccharide flippase family protein n=1 Tax=Shewanella TaxID=22 RepID=UPI001F20EDB0|nr:oligosaccharide flippase family protein [Shewanella indica]